MSPRGGEEGLVLFLTRAARSEKRLSADFRAVTPSAAGCGPRRALEPETVEGRGRGERSDAIEADPRPVKAALLEHSARGSVGHSRPGVEHLVAEMLEGVIDHRARGFGGVAHAPKWNGEPIADLGRRCGLFGNSAGAEHGRITFGDEKRELAEIYVRAGDKRLRISDPVRIRNAQRIRDAAVIDERSDRSRVFKTRRAQDKPLRAYARSASLPQAFRRNPIGQGHHTGFLKSDEGSRIPVAPLGYPC